MSPAMLTDVEPFNELPPPLHISCLAPFDRVSPALPSNQMKHLRISFSFPRGNYFSALHTPAPPAMAVVKVVLSDGRVHEFDDPLTAAELMLEHPREVVVEFDSQMITAGRRPVPLPADKKLEAEKVYMMLPMKRGKPASLASEETRRVVSNANAVMKQLSSSTSFKFLPLFARACTAKGHYEENFVKLLTTSLKKEKGCDEEVEIVKKTANSKRLISFLEDEDEKEEEEEDEMSSSSSYLSRQLSGKGWKPTLDTIKEKKIEQQKLPHWLF